MQKFKIDPPLVTLSIVSHGDSKKVIQLLDSLRRHEHVDRFQIIITENLEEDFVKSDGTDWQGLTIIRNRKPLGFALNHNNAFQLALGTYFCVLNPDVVFKQEVFHSLIRLIEIGQADIVSPLIVDSSNISQDSFRDFPTPFVIIQRRLPGYRFIPPYVDANGLVRPDWIAGTFMLMKRDTYLEMKGFDERYRLYFEDVDLCARAKLAKLKIAVDTNVRVQHDANRASRKKLIYLLWHLQSSVRFFTSPIYKRATQKSE